MDMNNKMSYLTLAITFMIGLVCPTCSSTIKEDERVIFFPTSAHLDKTGTKWKIPIKGWIFEPEENSIRRELVVLSLKKIILENEPLQVRQRFEERVRMFLVDNERFKRISIYLNGKEYKLNLSRANGHFNGEVQLDAATLNGKDRVTFNALKVKGGNEYAGTCYLVPSEGVSVISDIDDTIKHTNVNDRSEMLENAFINEYQSIPGMSGIYKKWQKEGASFFYVSSSPWQIYPALQKFLKAQQFPGGSLYLKTFRLKDKTVFNLFKSSEKTKPPIIRKILKNYPKRKFILVGDSGEHDPEVYGIIASEFPNQVVHIYIRKVTFNEEQKELEAEKHSMCRFIKAFENISNEKWTVFSDAGQLKEIKDI
jgi:phosphatidate phosphatase APP1